MEGVRLPLPGGVEDALKKILVFMSSLGIGGVERSLVSLLNSLDGRRYRVTLVLLFQRPDELKKYLPPGVEIVPFPAAFRFLYIPRGEVLSSFRAALGRNLNACRFAFFLAKGLLAGNMGAARQGLIEACLHTVPPFAGQYDAAIDYTGNFKTLLLHKVDARRKISWVHGDYRILGRDQRIDGREYPRLDHIATVSETCRDVFVRHFPQCAAKTVVLPNITAEPFIRKLSEESPAVPMEEGTPSVLSIMRLDPGKGLKLAAEACALLKMRGVRFKWYILGEGPERDAVERLIAEKGLQQHFILLGAHPNPYPYFRAATVVAHCSYSEGRSVAIDEAMLMRKPILVTDYPTARDQITDGVTGVICALTADSVADHLQALLRDGGRRSRLAENLGHFSLPVGQSLALFDTLTDAGGKDDA